MGSVFENDRKRFKRFPEKVFIKFRRLDLSQAQREFRMLNAVISRTSYVSDMGVFIPTFEFPEVEAILEIHFCFEPQEREIKDLARVAWVSHEKDQAGMGVEIFKISQDLFSSVVTRSKRGNWIEVEPEKGNG